jgi:hypothetical protein
MMPIKKLAPKELGDDESLIPGEWPDAELRHGDESKGTDDTTVIPPDQLPTQARAYSDAVDYDDALQTDTQLAPAWTSQHHSWTEAWSIVGIVAMVAAVTVMGVLGWMLLQGDDAPTASAPSTMAAAALPQTPVAAPTTTVTVQAAPPPPPSEKWTPSPAPPPPTPRLSGRYTMTETLPDNGHGITQVWIFTPCGDGCADQSVEGHSWSSRANLSDGFWTWDAIGIGIVCPDGSRITDAGNAHYAIDATTLRGTAHMTWNRVCPGAGQSTAPNTNNITLVRAD